MPHRPARRRPRCRSARSPQSCRRATRCPARHSRRCGARRGAGSARAASRRSDRPKRQRHEAQHGIDQGRFAGSGGADEGDDAPGRQNKINVAQHRTPAADDSNALEDDRRHAARNVARQRGVVGRFSNRARRAELRTQIGERGNSAVSACTPCCSPVTRGSRRTKRASTTRTVATSIESNSGPTMRMAATPAAPPNSKTAFAFCMSKALAKFAAARRPAASAKRPQATSFAAFAFTSLAAAMDRTRATARRLKPGL